MANLPAPRVTPSRPFSHSGVDYAGPFLLRQSRERGVKSYKGYISVFVCLASKAVHLEVVSDYSAQAFLMAFRRFVSRRGLCNTVYSDQGTTFVGADRELRELHQQDSKWSSKVIHQLSIEGVKWKFNPPGAPHFRGI